MIEDEMMKKKMTRDQLAKLHAQKEYHENLLKQHTPLEGNYDFHKNKIREKQNKINVGLKNNLDLPVNIKTKWNERRGKFELVKN